MTKQVQPMNTFFHANVKPGDTTSIKLSGGQTEPFYYSLGANSTVPFIRLEGGGGSQKEFTWGETIEVPMNQQLQVRSASYMAGDIQIQSGRDIANKPKRITLPCQVEPFTSVAYAPGTSIKPIYPCDGRTARQAYIGLFWNTGNGPIAPTYIITGLQRQHSYPSDVSTFFQVFDPPGKKYRELIGLSQPFTIYTQLPLGWGATYVDPGNPHTLLDQIFWEIITDNGFIFSQFFYILEY